ncbi:endoplasmic reticulum metallopeptidase 1-like isoform X2 [Clavelina lepadiformis]|uniref:endoplasmic reticulum metallopeptidase 1-like isoform X2 n=1 Tax=Clavelina lepadiformis TaxID=159417 RepID=UPI004041E278
MVDPKLSVRRRGQHKVSRSPQLPIPSSEDRHMRKENGRRKDLSQKSTIFFFLVYYSAVFYIVRYSVNYLPNPKSLVNSKPTEFTEEQARKHLNYFVSLGPRVAGSLANDVHAANYILETVLKVKASVSPSLKVEIDTQRPTGSFTLDFVSGFGSYYTNVTNTIVRVSAVDSPSNHALLLNCHTDSVNGAPGASDDAVACAVLLEVMRAVTSDHTHPLLHDIIFLFNGAEENLHQASHGFITQHPWAKQVKGFINLEAAGAGGKEIVFQTGPSHPWLASAWAMNAPHPFGTVIAQELFQSGIIPSDTDFRIFRDYGKIPGIDLAYMTNGYVYHTLYDDVDRILPGCIQRAGDNILAVVDHLVKSPSSLLPNPGSYRHGALAFMDFLGIFMITLPMRMLSILNMLFSVGPIIYLARCIMSSAGIVIIMSSWLACAFVVFLLAIFVTKCGNSMAFFSRPYLVVFLYGLPGLAALLIVNRVAASIVFKNEDPWMLETIFFDSYLFIWSAILFQINYIQLQSSLILLLCVLPLCLIRCLFLKKIFHHKNDGIVATKVTVYLAALLPHTLILFSLSWIGLDLFIPLCGRLGTVVPPDLVIAGLVALLLILLSHFVLSLIHLAESIQWIVAGMLLLSAGALCFVLSSHAFPYAVDNDITAPQRLIVQHISRTFYGFDKKVRQQDSGIWLNTMDYPGFKVDTGSNAANESPLLPCKGLFCHFPFLVPLNKFVTLSKYIPADEPSFSETGIQPFSVRLIQDETTKISENSTSRTYKKRLSFVVDGPSHISVHVAPLSSKGISSKLTSWIVEDEIERSRSKPTSIVDHLVLGDKRYHYADWHFLYYGSGIYKETWTPWFEFEITQDSSLSPLDGSPTPTVELAFMAQYYSTPLSAQSRDLKEFLAELHRWVAPMGWVSFYENHLF